MPRPIANAPLSVFVNGRLVGALKRESSGAIDFRYDAQWLSWQSTFPISLSLPLREDRYIGAPVINVFDSLLPDSEPTPDIPIAIVALFEIRQDHLDVSGQTAGSSTSRLPRQRSHGPVIVASGDSVCSVARRHGLSPHQLFGWRRPLREAAGGYYEEEVQAVPAVVDAVMPAAAHGHERGACAENSVQTTGSSAVVHFAGAYSANMSAAILRDIRSFPSSP